MESIRIIKIQGFYKNQNLDEQTITDTMQMDKQANKQSEVINPFQLFRKLLNKGMTILPLSLE